MKTPLELAKDLGVEPKRLRAWLRLEFQRPEDELGSPWLLDDKMCAAARRHFTKD